jgi:hypothetical protein
VWYVNFYSFGDLRTFTNFNSISSLSWREHLIYLRELQKELATSHGVCVSLGTISQMLKKRGFTCKKLGIIAREQNERAQAEYLAWIQQYNADQLVFADELSCDCRMGRCGYGWAPMGTRLRRRELSHACSSHHLMTHCSDPIFI